MNSIGRTTHMLADCLSTGLQQRLPNDYVKMAIQAGQRGYDCTVGDLAARPRVGDTN